ncbi:MAG: TldD/PmbA family protein [Tissierellia bacterium]|nr:TldD/PmbA family protein [Tissierellia bacterium]
MNLINSSTIERVLTAALENGGDFAELFIEDRVNSSINLIDNKIEQNLSGRDYGVGIRIISGFNTVYAYTNDDDEANLISIARKASVSLNKSNIDLVLNFDKPNTRIINPIKVYPRDVDVNRKIELMKKGYDVAKNYDDSISQVQVGYLDWDQKVRIANTEGLYVEDRRVRTRYSISSVAAHNGEYQTGSVRPGASMGFEFYDNLDIDALGKEASQIAVTMSKAKYAPSGSLPVIMDNAFGGVLFHEACGHGLEASFVSKGTSVYTGLLGQKIASDCVTAIDDGTIENEWGSLAYDDEGTPTQRNVLIENGILKSYLVDRVNGARMNMPSTGSCRRESYRYKPTSRMTNTFIDSGNNTREEMFAGVEKGLYAKKLGGGSVNITTGEFNFAVMEGYLIENGKITEPVRGASLIGSGREVLEKIDMVGSDLSLAEGMCGAASGSIPAGVGQPPVRIKELTVGGR